MKILSGNLREVKKNIEAKLFEVIKKTKKLIIDGSFLLKIGGNKQTFKSSHNYRLYSTENISNMLSLEGGVCDAVQSD